jgi:hypothetical protein
VKALAHLRLGTNYCIAHHTWLHHVTGEILLNIFSNECPGCVMWRLIIVMIAGKIKFETML